MFDPKSGVEVTIVPRNSKPREWYDLRDADGPRPIHNKCQIEATPGQKFAIKIKLHPGFEFRGYASTTAFFTVDGHRLGLKEIMNSLRGTQRAFTQPIEVEKSFHQCERPKSVYIFRRQDSGDVPWGGNIEVKLRRGYAADKEGHDVYFKFEYALRGMMLWGVHVPEAWFSLTDYEIEHLQAGAIARRIATGVEIEKQTPNDMIEAPATREMSSNNPPVVDTPQANDIEDGNEHASKDVGETTVPDPTSRTLSEIFEKGFDEWISQDTNGTEIETPATDAKHDATGQPEPVSAQPTNETITAGTESQHPKDKARARALAELEMEEIDLSEQEIQIKKRRLQAKRRLLELSEDED